MRIALAAALLVLLAPARANADPFGELPFLPVAGVATCVRATGVPGELGRWTPQGVELLRADGGGMTSTGTIALGRSSSCPEIASAPGGAAAVAARVSATAVRVAVREPGGAFGAPATIAARVSVSAVAVSPAGDVVIGGEETDAGGLRSRVVAVRRRAGGAFGAPEALTAWADSTDLDGVGAGVDATGRATLVWSRAIKPGETVVETASAPAGAAFGAPARVGPAEPIAGATALAVAPDGRALVAFPVGDGIDVAERDPGAAGFGAPHALSTGATFLPPAVALADGGAAVVAWRSEGEPAGVSVATRAAAGPFGAARDVVTGAASQFGESSSLTLSLGSGTAPPRDRTDLRAAIAGTGFALTWADGLLDGGDAVPDAAAGELAGGPVPHAPLAAAVRPAESIAPLALADGRAAVAWADDAGAGLAPGGDGRLHLAIAGAAPAPAAAAPELTVPRLARRRLHVAQALPLPLRSGGPCDVRATIPGRVFPVVAVAGRASAGPLTLRLEPGVEPLEKAGARRLTVSLRYAAPGSRASETMRVSVPLTLIPSPPVPKLLDVRARRSGHDLVVTWRTSAPARGITFGLVAVPSANRPPVTATGLHGGGRRSFRHRLKGAARARRVFVEAFSGIDRRPRVKTVSVG